MPGNGCTPHRPTVWQNLENVVITFHRPRTIRLRFTDARSLLDTGLVEFDEEKERKRLRKMSDEELIGEGKGARYLCAPSTTLGRPPREEFVIGLHVKP